MIYRILYNKQEIYGPDLDQAVLNPVLEVELNSAGKLEFTLPVTRSTTIDPETGEKEYPDDIWKTIQVFSGEVEVWEEDDCIFYGRPLQIIRDWNNQKKVVCEGALAYFNDSVQPTHEYEKSNTVLYKDDDYPNSSGFFNKLIDKHNNQLEKDDVNSTTRRFKVGEVDVENSKVYRKTDFETTAECLQSMCLDTNGGYFLLRKEYDDEEQDYVNVIDWRKAAPYGTSQSIDFGINLLDITQDLNGSDLCTVLYPTAGDDIFVDYATKYTEENPYEVKDDLNNVTGHILHEARAEKYITHMEGYKKYGRIVKVKDFDITEIDDSDPDYQHKNSQALFKKAAKWLNDQNQEELTIECSAADIHYLSHIEDYADKDKLKLGQMVQVTDEVHGVVRELPIYKMSMNLDSGIKKITLGTPPKKELTDIVKTSTSSSTRGSSGSKGGGSSDTGGSGSGGTSVDIPVTDVKVKKPGASKYKSVVDNKVAKIDLTDIDGMVTDVQIDGTSIVDQDGVADIDSSQFGVSVEANPAEPATDDLDTIKIGDTVYDIPGSGGGGSSVVPNPSGNPENRLIKVSIDGTIYEVSAGNTDEQYQQFGYTGSIQTFEAPETGTYKLEVWGAQGGSADASVHGGYGGYSIGYIDLDAGDILYVCVGGRGGGNATSDTNLVGYNGGGAANFGGKRGNGGGATHIAKVTGILSSLSSNINDILIVAGGGGGAGQYGGNDKGDGGSGGGYIGGHGLYNDSTTGDSNSHTGSGGTQLAGGDTDNYSEQSVGSFGQGASRDGSSLWGGSGGGGGFYGGGASTNNAGAGGGSGYINVTELTDACMYGHSVSESAAAATKTVSVTTATEDPTPLNAKIGDGFAKISWGSGEFDPYVTVNDLYNACIANNVTPESHSLDDIVACFLTGGGGGKTQINPFPSGASTITFYHSNGVTIITSTIAADGTGSLSFSEVSAGYEGFVIELNVEPGYTYEVEFDYQNVDCEYFVNQYMLGYILESNPRTDYSRYTEWQNNIERIATLQHFTAAAFSTGTKLYLNFNVCGYSDGRTNYAALTNLKVYKMS